VRVVLPHGLFKGGSRHCEADLRPIRGRDEVLIAEVGGDLPSAARTTLLLSRCVIGIGGLATVDEDLIGSLTVGDREALLLQVRRMSIGDRMSCVLACPRCGERLDVDLFASELLAEPYKDVRERYAFRPQDGSGVLTFRLPTGADQAAVAAVALDDPGAAFTLMLERCLSAPDDRAETSGAGSVVGAASARELELRMRELDPQAETRLDMRCPACGEPWDVVFDTADYVFRELAVEAAELEQQVHVLALHYHWSEREILGLTHRKRRRYLELVAESVGGGRA